MKKMLYKIYHYKLSSFDTKEHLIIKFSNLLAVIGFSVSFLNSLIYLFLIDSFLFFLIGEFFAFSYLLYFYLLSKDRLLEAKIAILINFLVQIFILVMFFTSVRSGFHYYYFLSVPVSFLLFYNDKQYIRFGIPLGAFVLMVVSYFYSNDYYILKIEDNVFDILYIVSMLTIFIVLFFIMSVYKEESNNTEQELKYLSMTDPLTKIYNRRAFYEYAKKQIHYANRNNSVLGLILFDVDYFKKVNDNYGHEVGDLVLVEVSQLIKNTIRNSDYFARYGGEEFIILLPDITQEGLQLLCEKIRILVETSIIKSESNDIKITISLGCTIYIKDEKIENFIKRADVAMYESKDAGRNKMTMIKSDN